jgi:hypothetical protein
MTPAESGGARNITGDFPVQDPLVPFCDKCGLRADIIGIAETIIYEDGSRFDVCIHCPR